MCAGCVLGVCWVCAGCDDCEGDVGNTSFRIATSPVIRDVRLRPRPLPPVNVSGDT